jgi:hypothetical protein
MKRLVFFMLIVCATSLMAQTDLYNRYSGRTDVRVASVTNFTLDTGITADVTLLEAIDDQSWQWLCSTFGLATPTKEQEQQMEAGWDVTMFTQRSRQDPTKPAPVINEHIDQGNSCYLGVSYLTRTVYIFCCSTEKQSDVVIAYLIRKMNSARNQ